MDIECSKCGAINIIGGIHCIKCGAKLVFEIDEEAINAPEPLSKVILRKSPLYICMLIAALIFIPLILIFMPYKYNRPSGSIISKENGILEPYLMARRLPKEKNQKFEISPLEASIILKSVTATDQIIVRPKGKIVQIGLIQSFYGGVINVTFNACVTVKDGKMTVSKRRIGDFPAAIFMNGLFDERVKNFLISYEKQIKVIKEKVQTLDVNEKGNIRLIFK